MTRKLGETIPRALLRPWHSQVAKETWPGQGPGAPPFRGYCLLPLPRLSGGSSATLSATIPLHWSLAAAIPAPHLPCAPWRAASLPVAVPSCSGAGGMRWCLLGSPLAVGIGVWPLSPTSTPQHLHLIGLHHFPLSLLSPFPGQQKHLEMRPRMGKG